MGRGPEGGRAAPLFPGKEGIILALLGHLFDREPEGIDRGELRPHDTRAIATLLTARVEGPALPWLLDPGAIDRAGVLEQELRSSSAAESLALPRTRSRPPRDSGVACL